jgi:hypothetical protein
MQDGANVLFFTFINPSNMEVPRAFQKLGKLSTARPGSISVAAWRRNKECPKYKNSRIFRDSKDSGKTPQLVDQ